MSRRLPTLVKSVSKRFRRRSSTSGGRGRGIGAVAEEASTPAAAAEAPAAPASNSGRIPTEPDAYFELMRDRPVPPGCEGLRYGFRLRDQEWIVACTGDLTGVEKRPATGKSHGCDCMVVYKSDKVFARVAVSEPYATVAYVMGSLKVLGDMDKLELLKPAFPTSSTQASSPAAAEEGAASPYGATSPEAVANSADDSWAAELAPEVEPTDLLTAEFWDRHLGNDALFGAWLWFVGSLLLMAYYIVRYCKSTTLDGEVKAACFTVSAVMWAAGSYWFVLLSYPERMARMYMEIMKMDIEKLTFTERYFTANEYLVATWCFTLGVVPYFAYAAFLIIQNPESYSGYSFLEVSIGTLVVFILFSMTVMPDAMKQNNGQGSSALRDYVFLPCFCPCSLCFKQQIKEFADKHLFSDFMASLWLFAIISFIGSAFEVYELVKDPCNPEYWLLFWLNVCFFFGSTAMCNSMYPGQLRSRVYYDTVTCNRAAAERDEDDWRADDAREEVQPLITA